MLDNIIPLYEILYPEFARYETKDYNILKIYKMVDDSILEGGEYCKIFKSFTESTPSYVHYYKSKEVAKFYKFTDYEQHNIFPNGFSGVVKEYDLNGQLTIEYYMNNNMMEGIYKSYYDNGQILLEYNYVNNLQHGESIDYYYNGNIYVKCNYNNGKLCGKYIEYYDNGNIKKICSYTDDNLDGEYISYNINGVIIEKKIDENKI